MRGEFPANAGSLCCLVGIKSAFGNTVQRDHDQWPVTRVLIQFQIATIGLWSWNKVNVFLLSMSFIFITIQYSSDSDQVTDVATSTTTISPFIICHSWLERWIRVGINKVS